MERVEFRLSSFVEFMYALKDFNESLTKWEKENPPGTWNLDVVIEENEYIIYLTINESKDKGK